MNLIDRYVYVVTERLPEDAREDVSRELRANIEDMLPENATEADIRVVLEKLGNPAKLAAEYSQDKRYLIGPGLYDSYFSVLKLVIGIVSIVFIFISLLVGVLNPSVDGGLVKISIDVFIKVIGAAIQGIMQAFLWVTVTFVILERTGVGEGKLPFVRKEWSPGDLPTLPLTNKRKISRVETVFSMFSTVFCTMLLYYKPQLIGWYGKGTSGLTFIPLFVAERLHSYFFAIILLASVQLCIFIWKFISRRWHLPLAAANTACNMAMSILLCVILRDNSLVNQEFLAKLADFIKIPFSLMTTIWVRGIWTFGVSFIVICILDSVIGFVKCKK